MPRIPRMVRTISAIAASARKADLIYANGLFIEAAVAAALERAQKQGRVRKDVDCRAAALFIVSAYEGCIGIAKNLQSVKEFRLCMAQLDAYVQGLEVRR